MTDNPAPSQSTRWRPISEARGQEEYLVCRAGMLGQWAIAVRLLGEWRTSSAHGGDPLPFLPTHFQELETPPHADWH